MRVFLLLTIGLLASMSCSRGPTAVQTETQQNANTTTATAQATPRDPTVLFTIPVGDNGIHYADTDIDELEPWGPSSFTIAPDGTYLIVDSVANRILRFKPDGTQLPPIPVDDAVGITDVTTTSENVYVLDQKGMSPTLFRLSNEGRVEEKIDLMRARGGPRSRLQVETLTGITTAQNDAIVLEYEDLAAPRDLNNVPALDRAFRGNPFTARVRSLQTQAQEGGKGLVLKNGEPFAEIKVENLIAELKVLGVNAAGDVYIIVDEIIPAPVVTIDQTVRRYRADGTPIDMARVPLADYYTRSDADTVAIRPDGGVDALITRSNNRDALVKHLEFKPQLDPILPKTTFTPAAAATPAGTCSRTRAQMVETARQYHENRTSLTLDNLNGACGGRRKPKYLGTTAGVYPSVPYDWGGFDTVADYRNAMSAGFQAGDTETCRGDCVEPCSKGVDCSGFVSRVWATNHEYTSTLPNIANEINILELKPGDILNLPNRHVVLFEKFAGQDPQKNGLWAFEATTGGYDRVIYRQTNWRRWLGYTARRFKRVCAS